MKDRRCTFFCCMLKDRKMVNYRHRAYRITVMDGPAVALFTLQVTAHSVIEAQKK